MCFPRPTRCVNAYYASGPIRRCGLLLRSSQNNPCSKLQQSAGMLFCPCIHAGSGHLRPFGTASADFRTQAHIAATFRGVMSQSMSQKSSTLPLAGADTACMISPVFGLRKGALPGSSPSLDRAAI